MHYLEMKYTASIINEVVTEIEFNKCHCMLEHSHWRYEVVSQAEMLQPREFIKAWIVNVSNAIISEWKVSQLWPVSGALYVLYTVVIQRQLLQLRTFLQTLPVKQKVKLGKYLNIELL